MAKILLLLLIATSLQAQQSDMLILKKQNRAMRYFFKGSQMEFYTTEKTFVSAVVDSIKRDSVFLLYYDAQMRPTLHGGQFLDTLGVYPMAFSLNNIYSFPARQRGVSLFTNGTLFVVGGSGYLLLNIINTVREKQPLFASDNVPRLAGGASAVLIGWLLSKSRKTEYRLGRKYRLVYLPAN